MTPEGEIPRNWIRPGIRRETLESAVQHLSAALESDPEFPLAHAWLSFVSMSFYFTYDPRPIRLEQAEHHASRALALDPALPEGHLARASILWSPAKGFQHADALEALGRVVAVQPDFERAYNRIASICHHIGRFEEARQAGATAKRSNPKTRSGNLEFIHLYSGDFARAEEGAEAWLRERPGVTYALWFYPQPPLLSGRLDVAEQRYSRLAPTAGNPDVYSRMSLKCHPPMRRWAARHVPGGLLQGIRFPVQKRAFIWAFSCEIPGNGKSGRWRERRARQVRGSAAGQWPSCCRYSRPAITRVATLPTPGLRHGHSAAPT